MATKGSARNWFLTIHPEAECFDNIDGIIKALPIFEFYAWIQHKGDDEDEGKHRHLVVCCRKGGTLGFQDMQEAFKGAHIEPVNSIEGSVAYLTHSTWQAQEDGKERYSLTDIHTNNKRLVEDLTIEGSKEPFNEDKMIKYITDGTRTPIDFYQRFGGKAFKDWMRTYNELTKAWLDRHLDQRKEATATRAISLIKRVAQNEDLLPSNALNMVERIIEDLEDGVISNLEEYMKD